MKKKFGQNFLINKKIIETIINSLKISKESLIYEVGPGDGSLSKEIIKKNPKKYIAVEIDSSLKKDLTKIFINKKYFVVYNDALKINELKYFKEKTTIVGNLPYNISLKLLVKWIYQFANNPWFETMILMFQKEVGERILSQENSRKYGRISILVSSFFNVEVITNVNKNDFYPVPKVDSMVLKFTPLNRQLINSKNLKKLEHLTNYFFSNRRKILKKKIINLFSKDIIENNHLEYLYSMRPENLKKEIFFDLIKLIK